MVVYSCGIVYLSWCEILLNNRTILCSLNWNGATIIAAKVNDWMNYNVNAWDRFKSRCHVLLRFRTENEWKREKRSMTYCFVLCLSLVYIFFPFEKQHKTAKEPQAFQCKLANAWASDWACVCGCVNGWEREKRTQSFNALMCENVHIARVHLHLNSQAT